MQKIQVSGGLANVSNKFGVRLRCKTYTTADTFPSAPPQPISIIEKVKVEITKLLLMSANAIHECLKQAESVPHKAQRCRIGKALDIVSYVRNFGSEIEL